MPKPHEPIDMSSDAITARLEDVRQLYRLCMSLMEAGRAAGLHDARPASSSRDHER